jgi:pilus assembly protein CpaB
MERVRTTRAGARGRDPAMRTIATLIVAVLLAGAAGLLVRGQAPAPEPEPPAPVAAAPTVPVLVAGRGLDPGDLVRRNDLAWQAWPERALAPTLLRREDVARGDLAGSVVRRAVAAGQPLLATDVVQPGDRGFLAAVLDPGKRAVSVATTDSSGVAGLIYPGDRVDVILTQGLPAEGASGSDQVSQTLMSGLRAVAVGRSLAPAATRDSSDAERSGTITLEVSPDQARRIALAKDMGRIDLVLHSLAEADSGAERGGQVTRRGDMLPYDQLGRPKPEAAARTIRVIQGDEETEVRVDDE